MFAIPVAPFRCDRRISCAADSSFTLLICAKSSNPAALRHRDLGGDVQFPAASGRWRRAFQALVVCVLLSPRTRPSVGRPLQQRRLQPRPRRLAPLLTRRPRRDGRLPARAPATLAAAPARAGAPEHPIVTSTAAIPHLAWAGETLDRASGAQPVCVVRFGRRLRNLGVIPASFCSRSSPPHYSVGRRRLARLPRGFWRFQPVGPVPRRLR